MNLIHFKDFSFEIIDLIHSGISSVNRKIPVEVIKKEQQAIKSAIQNAVPGSLIVLLSDAMKNSYRQIIRHKNLEKKCCRNWV
jgi:hypothetical protein